MPGQTGSSGTRQDDPGPLSGGCGPEGRGFESPRSPHTNRAQLEEHFVLDARTAPPSRVLARSALRPFGLWAGHIQAVGQVLPDQPG